MAAKFSSPVPGAPRWGIGDMDQGDIVDQQFERFQHIAKGALLMENIVEDLDVRLAHLPQNLLRLTRAGEEGGPVFERIDRLDQQFDRGGSGKVGGLAQGVGHTSLLLGRSHVGRGSPRNKDDPLAAQDACAVDHLRQFAQELRGVSKPGKAGAHPRHGIDDQPMAPDPRGGIVQLGLRPVAELIGQLDPLIARPADDIELALEGTPRSASPSPRIAGQRKPRRSRETARARPVRRRGQTAPTYAG
jgi:hypothetical protein